MFVKKKIEECDRQFDNSINRTLSQNVEIQACGQSHAFPDYACNLKLNKGSVLKTLHWPFLENLGLALNEQIFKNRVLNVHNLVSSLFSVFCIQTDCVRLFIQTLIPHF